MLALYRSNFLISSCSQAFFIDLDLKPLEKMEHYYKLDQKIVRCYTQIAKDGCLAKRDGSAEPYKRTN